LVSPCYGVVIYSGERRHFHNSVWVSDKYLAL
jgi:hypothetical protein